MSAKSTKKNTYKVGGVELVLKQVPALFINRWEIEYDKLNRPQIPLREVTFAGGRTAVQHDDTDPLYKRMMEQFEGEKSQAQIEWIINYAVENDPPMEWQVPEGLGESSYRNRKITWVESLFDETGDGLSEFVMAAMGQTIPQEAEIDEEMDALKSHGEREAPKEVRLQE